MDIRVLAAAGCAALSLSSCARVTSGDALRASAGRLVYVHVDFQNAKERVEAKGVVAVLPTSGDAASGVGAVTPCGEAVAVAYHAPPDHVAVLGSSPCDPKPKVPGFVPGLGIVPYAIISRPLHPDASTIDPRELDHLGIPGVAVPGNATQKYQVFATGTNRSVGIDELRAQVKSNPNLMVMQIKT